jgi:hypothetical protein
MAGSITVSSITLDSDNNFSIKSNTGATLFFANTSGVDIANSIGATAITSDKILSIANTKISGNIISSQIASVNGSVITANTIANSAIQTGAVENYMNAAGLGFGMRNRIINGAMVIDQRNAGASVTNTTSNLYVTDRWNIYGQQASKFTAQQNAGSVTPPTGFKNYLGITSSSAYTVLSGDNFKVLQPIEGYNFADMGWGAAGASSVTLSFWVRSSLTGTFGGSFTNSSYNRSYPFTYTISSANTWEQKTVTIAGDTSGTWLTTNGIGVNVIFSMGMGTDQSGTAGAWAGANYQSATGAVSVVGTNGATWYITGVQLEKGSTATSFDYRPYGTELALCQRYYEIIAPVQASFLISVNATASTQEFEFLIKYLVLKRATATVTRVGTWTDSNSTGVVPLTFGTDLFCLALFSSGSGRCYTYNTGSGSCFTASAEL